MTATGTWTLTMSTPMGEQTSTLIVADDGTSATMTGPDGEHQPAVDFTLTGAQMKWKIAVKKPIPLNLHFDVSVEGETLTGKFRPGMFPSSPVTGVRG